MWILNQSQTTLTNTDTGKVWVSLAHKFCPNCGAKFEAEQALKERENNG